MGLRSVPLIGGAVRSSSVGSVEEKQRDVHRKNDRVCPLTDSAPSRTCFTVSASVSFDISERTPLEKQSFLLSRLVITLSEKMNRHMKA